MFSKFFKILSYSEENLADALSTRYFSRDNIINNKFHYKFLLEYLGKKTDDALKAETVLIEFNYLSRDYLYDFSNYYSLCFSDEYLKKTKRIHFFKTIFTEQDFLNEYISNSDNFVNNQSYLGYVVVKPLPNVLIGKTLLKTYSDNRTEKNDETNNGHTRKYTTRSNKVHIFGRELLINSVAFQEQDKTISACATCALWSAFQKTTDLFQTYQPTPFEITNTAKNLFLNTGRNFPNSGLDEFQIGNVINNLGLVYELRHSDEYLNDNSQCKAFIYSYLKMGIPILLGIEIEDVGYHLITILGFKEKKNKVKLKNGLALKSDQIEMFYAHDDQVGPYSRLEFKQNAFKEYIETSWWKDIKGKSKHRATIESIFIPLYDKIRITFDNVHKSIKFINLYLNHILTTGNVTWDIYLFKSDSYKESILLNKHIEDSKKHKLLFKSLPKYIWIAEATVNGIKILEFLYDSTDMAHGLYCIGFNCYSENIKKRIKETELKNSDFKEFITQGLHSKFYDILFEEVTSE